MEKHCSGYQEFVASACYPNAALRLSGNYIFDALSAHLNGYAGAAALMLAIADAAEEIVWWRTQVSEVPQCDLELLRYSAASPLRCCYAILAGTIRKVVP